MNELNSPSQQIFENPWHRLQLAVGELEAVNRAGWPQPQPLRDASVAESVFADRSLHRIFEDAGTDRTKQLLVDGATDEAVDVESHF